MEHGALGMRIVESANRRAIASLLDWRPGRDPVLERRVARIVERVRTDGDAALLKYARSLDGLDGSIEVTTAEIEAGAKPVLARFASSAVSVEVSDAGAVDDIDTPEAYRRTTSAAGE